MESWRDVLPDELKVHPTLSKFATPADLAKSYAELEAWKGGAIRVPGKDAGTDAWNEFTGKLKERVPQLMFKPDPTNEEQMKLFYDTLGVPNKAEEYDIKGVEGLQPQTLEKTRAMAAAGKLTPHQHKAVTAWLVDEAKQTDAAMTEYRKQQAVTLTKHWGDSLQQRQQRVDEFIKQEAIEPLEEINAAGYLILDKMIDALTGKGPQAFDLPSSHEVGPTIAELETQRDELIARMSKEGLNMPNEERKRLRDKLGKVLEGINKAQQRAA